MKKIITVCVLSILMLSGAVQAGNNNTVNLNPSPSASFSVWVKLIITFHRPKTQCQSGFGICFDVDWGIEKSATMNSNLCLVQARINPEGQFELRVSGEDLLNYENGFALPYFKKGSITLEDPYTFSAPVSKELGAARQITVKPGTYRVAYDASADTYTVAFPI